MNNCSPWIHEIYQGIFEICTDLGILVVNAKYAQQYTVAYTRFFAQCLAPKLELCMSVLSTETQRSTVACVCQIEFNKLYVFTMHLYISIVM